MWSQPNVHRVVSYHLHMCRTQPTGSKESSSHMLDLLDVSLGAASPPPPTGNMDPWGMPAPPRPQVGQANAC